MQRGALTFGKLRKLRTTRADATKPHILPTFKQLKLALQRIIPPRALPLPASALRKVSAVVRDDLRRTTLPFGPYTAITEVNLGVAH